MGAVIREANSQDVGVEVFRRGADDAEIAVASTTLPLESLKGKRKDPMLAIQLPGGVTVHCAIKWSGVKDSASAMLVSCSIS
ncbi:hypothetical protein PINS_up012853 [Pythium insidiosum]|nr:hypothetical protein PINS_up012853 [Pythium insidiosum]